MKVSSIHESVQVRRPVITIGTFDGVHAGHRFILEELRKQASAHGGESVVVTLWPHPRLVLNRDVDQFRLLHTREEKIRELGHCGIDHLVIIPFTREIASLSACDFVQKYLVAKLGVQVLLLGYDNRFGRDRKGDPGGLQRCARENRFLIRKLPEFRSPQGRVSSTAIRDAIEAGNLDHAREMLGYPYYLAGTVVEGSRLGRKIGFPTANIHPLDPYKLIPMNGDYAVKAELMEKTYRGMLNIGFRPTIDSASPVRTVEVHLFGAAGDFYGSGIVVHFIKRIRDEMKFSGVEELRAQLEKDRDVAHSLLR